MSQQLPPPPPPPPPSNPYAPQGYSAPPAYPGYGASYPYPVAGQQYAGGGGTAITAAILAFLGVVGQGVGGVLGVIGGIALTSQSGTDGLLHTWLGPWSIASSAVAIVLSVLLLIGGIQLLRHRSSGRALIALGCVGVIVTGVAGIVISLAYTAKLNHDLSSSFEGSGVDSSSFNDLNSMTMGFGLVFGLIALIFPVVTLILALIPSTKRWCEPVVGPGYVTY